MHPARSILAIDSSPFGQSLAALPAMRALRASYPNAFILAAAADGTAELLMDGAAVDETIEMGVIKTSDGGRPGALKRALRLAGRVRRHSIDLVLDFSSALETQIVARLVVRARTITPSQFPRAIEILMGLAPRTGDRGASAYQSVLRQIGVELSDLHLAVSHSAGEDERFEQLLLRSGSRGGEPIAMLFAASPGDRRGWPVESFGEIGSRLANNFGARVVCADQPADESFTDAIYALLPNGAIKLAKPHALELAAALARASVVITDAPAIAQLASERDTPVIEVADSGPDEAAQSQTHRIVRGSSRRRVSTDEVFDIACQMIQESRSASLFQRP